MSIDYRSFSAGNTTSTIDTRWWLLPKSELPGQVTRIVEFLAKSDSRRQAAYQTSARLYGNVEMLGLSRLQAAASTLKDRVTYNVVQSGIDTITAKMAKNKPRPLFLTNGGDYKIQRKAKKLDQFCEGVFYENDAHSLGNTIFRDSAVFGDGIVHVFDVHGRVKFERVLPSELFVDQAEAFYGEPRQMHRVKTVDRQVLIEMFPSRRQQILEADSVQLDLLTSTQNISDQVTVVESWRLPSGPDAGDGIHCICIENADLFVEDWKEQFFPFARLPWSKRLFGYWSQGGAEQVQSQQLEINKLLWVVQRSLHMAGSFKVLVENGSKVVKEHLNNDIGAIITYAGTPPQYVTPPAVPMEIYNQINWLKQSAFEQLGVSMLSVASQKPAGLNSGAALREYNDIESDRFTTIGQAYEQFFLALARLTIWKAKSLYERTGSYQVTMPDRKFTRSIDWKDINLEEDEFYLQMYPVSSLPNDPAGRLQTIQEYVQAGFLNPRTARRLLDFPDLQQVEDLQNSSEDYLHMILGKMIDEGEYTPPEPLDDLALAKELMLEYYQQGKQNGLEEEKLQLLRTFGDQVDVLVQKSMPPPPLGAQGGPQAQPMPPPQSDLIPNVPGEPQHN